MSKSTTEGGVFKYTGCVIAKPAPGNVQAIINGNNVDISWEQPNFDTTNMHLQGYNIRRNGTKINSSLITMQVYTDINIPNGQHTYCVTAQYDIGASESTCKNVEVTVDIINWQASSESLKIYPNPSPGHFTCEFSLQQQSVVELAVLNSLGQIMLTLADGVLKPGMHRLYWNIESFQTGMYFLQLKTDTHVVMTKIIKQ